MADEGLTVNDTNGVAGGALDFVAARDARAVAAQVGGGQPLESGGYDPRALDELSRYGDHPSAFIGLNPETRHFRLAGERGFIVYRQAGTQ